MKKSIVLTFLTFLFVPHVNAECNNERIKELTSIAKNVEITYELDTYEEQPYNEETDKDYTVSDIGEPIPQGNMRIIITGITEEFQIKDITYNRTFMYNEFKDNTLILKNELNGHRIFKVYSAECDKEVRTIFIKVPRYNNYSTDPLCEGISGDELAVCGTWYENDIDYDTFKAKVEAYKQELKDAQNAKPQNQEQTILDKVVSFLKDYYLYFIIGIVAVIAITIIVTVRRKRSVLE